MGKFETMTLFPAAVSSLKACALYESMGDARNAAAAACGDAWFDSMCSLKLKRS